MKRFARGNPWPISFTAQDLDKHARLGIPPELLERAGIVRVTDREAREDYGIRGSGDMAGLAYPYFAPQTMANGRHRQYVRIRRDSPEIEDGKEKRKYVAPYGDRKHFYFPPTPELFSDTSVPIVLVEAEKSVLALTAWSERTGRKILPLAMGGAFGWKGKIEIKETATGERVPVTGPIPDLNICRDGRLTYVLLDSNCATNSMVQIARRDLVRQLRKQRAGVHILDLPASDGVNGPDDFVGIVGDEAMARVFDGSQDGAVLLDELAKYIRRFAVVSPEQATILAVYILHTHTIEASRFTPYIQVWSAVLQSGKTRLLEELELFVAKPWMTERVSAAALVRKISKSRPTLLLDESDTAFSGDKDYSEALRGILNAGFQRGGCAHVCVKKNGDWEVQEFRVFCPKVIAGIGIDKLPATVRDRSIPIEMKRRTDNETIEDFDAEDEQEAARPIRERIERWAEQNCNRLKSWPKPERLAGISDRQRDICNPLLKIADLVGGGWLPRLSGAITNIFGRREADESLGVKLLSDIRDAFDQAGADKLHSATLISRLVLVETSPWAECNQGKPITPTRLARLLKPFKIHPITSMRIGDAVLAGYKRDFFTDAWERYLPKVASCPHTPDAEPLHPLQGNVYAGETPFSETLHNCRVEDSKTEESPVFMRDVEDVEVSKGGIEDGERPGWVKGVI